MDFGGGEISNAIGGRDAGREVGVQLGYMHLRGHLRGCKVSAGVGHLNAVDALTWSLTGGILYGGLIAMREAPSPKRPDNCT